MLIPAAMTASLRQDSERQHSTDFATDARKNAALFDYNPGMDQSRVTAILVISLLFLSGLVPLSGAKADVYKYVDSQGRIYLTDRPPHDGYKLVLKSWKKPSGSKTSYRKKKSKVDYRNKEKNRQRFAAKIDSIAKRHGLPGRLIHAVVATESAYDPYAVSRAGAVGLMQLMPDTARRYGVTNRRDPSANLSGGIRYLKDLLERFDNNIELALAGYNAGENAVQKYGHQIPPFEETRSYVRKVMKIYEEDSTAPASDA